MSISIAAGADGRRPVERFAALDAIRGLAAVAVLGFHAYKDIVKRGPGGDGPLTTLAYSLDWGVVVFFVLSGFLLYSPFAEAIADRTPWPSVRRFLWRRAVRILPAYWLALVVYGTIARPTELWTPLGVLRYGLLQQVYSGSTVYHVLAPAWTLALEATFYLSVPLVAAWLGGRLLRPGGAATVSAARGVVAHLAGIAGLAVAGLVITKLVLAPIYGSAGEDPNLSTFTLFGTFPLFATGMALAVVRAHRRELAGLRAAIGPRAWATVRSDRFWLLLGAIAYVGALVIEGNHIAPWHSTYLPTVLAACLIVPLVFRPERSALARALGASRPLVWLGSVSYGIYLWHWPVQQLAIAHGWQVPHTWAGYAMAVVVTLAISLVPAWLSYRLLEAPLVEWAKRFGRPLAPNASAVPGHEPAPGKAPGASAGAAGSSRPGLPEPRRVRRAARSSGSA